MQKVQLAKGEQLTLFLGAAVLIALLGFTSQGCSEYWSKKPEKLVWNPKLLRASGEDYWIAYLAAEKRFLADCKKRADSSKWSEPDTDVFGLEGILYLMMRQDCPGGPDCSVRLAALVEVGPRFPSRSDIEAAVIPLIRNQYPGSMVDRYRKGDDTTFLGSCIAVRFFWTISPMPSGWYRRKVTQPLSDREFLRKFHEGKKAGLVQVFVPETMDEFRKGASVKVEIDGDDAGANP